MNTPMGDLSIPIRDGLNKNGLIPRVVRCRTTLGCIIDPLWGKDASLRNLKDLRMKLLFRVRDQDKPEEPRVGAVENVQTPETGILACLVSTR